jgi:hypothetical protein
MIENGRIIEVRGCVLNRLEKTLKGYLREKSE